MKILYEEKILVVPVGSYTYLLLLLPEVSSIIECCEKYEVGKKRGSMKKDTI